MLQPIRISSQFLVTHSLQGFPHFQLETMVSASAHLFLPNGQLPFLLPEGFSWPPQTQTTTFSGNQVPFLPLDCYHSCHLFIGNSHINLLSIPVLLTALFLLLTLRASSLICLYNLSTSIFSSTQLLCFLKCDGVTL